MATPAAQPQSRGPPIDNLIVALFLVKSKLANTSIHDHLANLKNFIRHGVRASNEGAGKRHLDSGGFWKDAYQKSEATHDELRARVADLEQRLEKRSAPAKEPFLQSKSQGKRKRVDEDAAEGPSTQSRKLGNIASQGSGQALADQSLAELASDLAVVEDKDVSIFLHDVHMLRRASSQRTISVENCTNLLVHAYQGIRRLIASIETPMQLITSTEAKDRKSTRTPIQTTTLAQSIMGDQAEGKLTAIAHIFPFLLNTVDQLGCMPGGLGISNLGVYHSVAVLRDILDRLFLLCATEGREKLAAALRMMRPKGRLRKEIAEFLPAPGQSRHNNEEVHTTTMLCQLGIAILNALNLSRAADRDVLDGFLFFLLDGAGSLLQDFVFNDGTNENVDPTSTTSNTEATAIRSAQAPHLLRLLQHALILSAKSSTPSTPRHRSTGRVPSLRVQSFHSSHNGISTEARIKLQNTLLRGVFGEDVSGLGEGLQKPQAFDFGPVVRKEGEGSVGSWFVNELWKTVGWDVLRDVIAWEERVGDLGG